MSKFTDTYKKASDVFKSQKFSEPDWQNFIMATAGIGKLLGPSGFDAAYATAPEKLRTKIDETLKAQKMTKADGVGEILYAASQNPKSAGTWFDRAATLNLVLHTHRAAKTGAQDVWVYAPPTAYTQPVFTELAGTEATVKRKLGEDAEIFSSEDRDLMCDALHISCKIAMDAMTKVATPTADTKEVVKRWFLDADCGDTELTDAISKLTAGLKLIAAACKSNTLVFTDYIDWRAQRDKYFGAAFRGGEGGGFPVVYLEGAFTRLKGNTGKLWLCAETIIHELSHHEVSTQDHRYDSSGLKPTKGTFPYAKAIDNADSWGYFALDLAGYLSDSDRAATLK